MEDQWTNDNSSQHAEEYVDNTCRFNDDVLVEILLCLPAKSVTRFKSVCKNWLSLISSDQFLFARARHRKLQPSLILKTTTSGFCFNPFLKKVAPFNFNIRMPVILSCCNGLMLLKSGRDYYAYNPTTKQSRKLRLTNNTMYPTVMELSLAFDPSKSPHYKIVCLRINGDRIEPLSLLEYQIEVYNSESRGWQICLEFAEQPIFSPFRVHCNNCVYWPRRSDAIPFYDIAQNVIKYLPCPNIKKPNCALPPYIQELNGHLHYCLVDKHENTRSVALWEMQGDNADDPRWFLKFRVTLPPPSSPIDVPLSVLMIWNGPDHIKETCISMELLGMEGKKVKICRFLNNSCRDDVDLRRQRFDGETVVELDFIFYGAYHLVECLAPV